MIFEATNFLCCQRFWFYIQVCICHHAARRCSMPMFNIRRTFNNITLTNYFDRCSFFLIVTGSCYYKQYLSCRMIVPIASCTGSNVTLRNTQLKTLSFRTNGFTHTVPVKLLAGAFSPRGKILSCLPIVSAVDCACELETRIKVAIK